MTTQPIDHPSRVLFPLGLGTALSLVGDTTLYAVLPTHTAEAGVVLGSLGILLSANRIVRVLLSGPAGLAYDRFRRRRLFVPALFVGALSTAVYAATQGFWPLLIGRLLWGLAWSGIWVGGATIVMDVTTARNRGRWMGLYQTWFFLGVGLGALVGGVLTDRVGYHATMWIGAALTALGGLVALFLLPETRAVRSDPDAGAEDSEGNTARGGLGARYVQGPRSARGLWVAASVQGINRFVVSGVLAATLGLVVQDLLHSGGGGPGVATLTGALAAARTLLSMLAALLAGTASDWLSSRWGMAAWALALGTISMGILAWPVPAAILVGVSLGAVTGGGVQAVVTSLVGDLAAPAQRGRAVGLLHTIGDLGSAAGPPVAYALLPAIGLPGVYLLCAILFAAGLALVLCTQMSIGRRKRPP